MTGSLRPASLVAILLASFLLLTGCTIGDATPATPAASAPAPNSTPGPPASAAPSSVTPVVPDPLTAASITNESTRLAEAIRALIDAVAIVNVDDHAQVVEKTASAGRYYGIIRTITLDPAADAAAVAADMVAKLTTAGWISRDSTTNGSTALSALASGEDAATSWFVIIGADASVPGESVLTIQLASPDLP